MEPEAGLSFTKMLTAYATVKLFFYSHRLCGRDEQHFFSLALVLFHLKCEV
jgi:hypothetical protein